MCITAGSERYSSSQTFLISEKKWRRYSLSGTENVFKILSSILSYISQNLTDQGLGTLKPLPGPAWSKDC